MTTYDDAAEERTANGEAVSFDPGPFNIREARSYKGRRIFAADSRPKRESLFADATGKIDSDSFATNHTCLTKRVRSAIWCMRVLEDEAGLDSDKLEQLSFVIDTLLTSIGYWMDDLDEVGVLSWKRNQSEEP